MQFRFIIIIILNLLFCNIVSANSSWSIHNNNELFFAWENFKGKIELNTLKIWEQEKLLADTPMYLGKVEKVSIEKHKARWHYPEVGLRVSCEIEKDRLHFKFISEKEETVIFPRTGRDKSTIALIIPEGEGLYIPVEDPFWQQQLNGKNYHTYGELSMPFWGIDQGHRTITYILHQDLNNNLEFAKETSLYTQLHHTFKNDQAYEVSIILTANSLIAPALEYRKYLQTKNLLKSLTAKAQENSNIQKLYGAFHIYLWGTGRTLEALKKLQALGLYKLWLGYDQDPRNHDYLVDKTLIQDAKKIGYLIGPYDSFHTMEDPKNANSINAIFGDLFPGGCIINKNGKLNIGFGGKGCHLSSKALADRKDLLNQRLNQHNDMGINSYFLDCDATGELFDDFSPIHSMNREEDRENRLTRMHTITSKYGLVLGSETAAAWAVPVLAFAHGNFSVHNAIHWPFTKEKAYGGWWPLDHPAFFLKTVEASSDYIKAKYEPAYRLPLFQAVFHDNIITTDRWELSHHKIKNATRIRELMEILYGIPSIWSLDMQAINKHAKHLQHLYQFFSPLHQAIATEPLTKFICLDNERKIQQTQFGNVVEITANFTHKQYKDIPPLSLEAHWLATNIKEIYQYEKNKNDH